MKVKELILELQYQPQDMEVIIVDSKGKQLTDISVELSSPELADNYIAIHTTKEVNLDNLAAKTEQIKKWEAVSDSWNEKLAEKDKEIQKLSDAYGCVLHAYNESRLILIEKDREISAKTKIIDHWRNEAGAFDLVCQKQSKEIAFLKETLGKASILLALTNNERRKEAMIEEIENLLK